MSTASQQRTDYVPSGAAGAALGQPPGRERPAVQSPAIVLRLPDVSPAAAPRAKSAATVADFTAPALAWLRGNVRFVAFVAVGLVVAVWLIANPKPAADQHDDREAAPAWSPAANGHNHEEPAGPQFPHYTPVPAWKTSNPPPEDAAAPAPAPRGERPRRSIAGPPASAPSNWGTSAEIRTARAPANGRDAAVDRRDSTYDQPPTARLKNVILKPNSTAAEGRAYP